MERGLAAAGNGDPRVVNLGITAGVMSMSQTFSIF